MYNSEDFRRSKVQILGRVASEGPAAPSVEVIAKLSAQRVPRWTESHKVATWCRAICHGRADCGKCVVIVTTLGEQKAYSLLFA
eukprot:305103-Lingulodinium_polyedra.AAC.1